MESYHIQRVLSHNCQCMNHKWVKLTAGVHGKTALSWLAGWSNSCSVGSWDSELVLCTFYELQHCVLQALHCRLGDWTSVDPTPIYSPTLPLLQPVALDGWPPVVQRWIPGQGHGGCCGCNDFRVTWRSRESERIFQLNPLWVTAIANPILVFSFEAELINSV